MRIVLKRIKRCKKDTEKLKELMQELGKNKGLPPEYQDHKLSGEWRGK